MSHTATLTDLLFHLIRMPTVTTDHATNRAALDWVEEQLHELPLEFKHYSHHSYPCLVATTPAVLDKKNPRLWLVGHMDVVPGEINQYDPAIVDGRLIGRGAADMKFAIACFIRLLQELGSVLASYDIGLMLTSDEEQGGINGAGWLVDAGYRGQAVLIPDGGLNWAMETGAKGLACWTLEATGESVHASTNWKGVNALDRLIDFILVLQTNAVAEPCGDPLHAHHTINLGILNGGTVSNKVPDKASAEIDIRLGASQSINTTRAWIQAASEAVPGVKASLNVSNDPYMIPQDGAVKFFREIALELTDHVLPGLISNGASDARFFAAHGIPAVLARPQGGNQHGPGEWVDVADLELYYAVMHRFVREWVGPNL